MFQVTNSSGRHLFASLALRMLSVMGHRAFCPSLTVPRTEHSCASILRHEEDVRLLYPDQSEEEWAGPVKKLQGMVK